VRLALIKTSSMGDVIHALPVVTDIVRAQPHAVVEWVVEDAFADLPALHPSVAVVHRVALRRWRRAPVAPAVRAEVAAARMRLAAGEFDLVLDLQGLLKSAWVARWARGPRAGFSFGCVRERLAALAYDHRYPVDMSGHAIERLRELAGQAIGYRPEGFPVFGLDPRGPALACSPGVPHAVLLHATSRSPKQWPQSNWIALVRNLADLGLASLLPWGSEDERIQAQAIALVTSSATVLPRLSLGECARLLRDAQVVVGVDTGLTHLACALGRPTVALFGATPAWRYGPYWTPRAIGLEACSGRWPSAGDVVDALGRAQAA
jgi:heptosyltransferase-1